MSTRGAKRPLSDHSPREIELVLGKTFGGRNAVTLYAWGGYDDGARIPFGRDVEILRQLIVDLQAAVAHLESDTPTTSC